MIKILETERQINEELGMDSFHVEYEVDGKKRGTTFSHYEEAIELIDGVERFKRKLSEKILREKNPKSKSNFVKKSIKINKFKGQTIEIKKLHKVKKYFNFEIDKIQTTGDFLNISIKGSQFTFKVHKTMEKKNRETDQPFYLDFIERELKKLKNKDDN